MRSIERSVGGSFSCSGIQLLGRRPGRRGARPVAVGARAASFFSSAELGRRPMLLRFDEESSGWSAAAAAAGNCSAPLPGRRRRRRRDLARRGRRGCPGPAWRPGATLQGRQGPSWGDRKGLEDGWWWASYFAFSSLCHHSGGREVWRQLRGGYANPGVGRAGFASGPSSHQLAE